MDFTYTDSLDRLPLAIYKSFMGKIYRSLNQPIFYSEISNEKIIVLDATEMYSPIHNYEYSLEREKKKAKTRRLNKEINISKQTFFEDFFKETT